MKQKINSSNYIKEIQSVFKRSPLAYFKISDIVDQLKQFKDNASKSLEDKDYYEAACIYKGLIEKSIEHLDYLEDREGKMGGFLFELFSLYSNTLQEFEWDEQNFFEETVELYVQEEFGFATEIIKLLIINVNHDNYDILETILKREIKKRTSTYERDKLVDPLLRMYNHIGEDRKYLDSCELYSPQAWERYDNAAIKYEQMGFIEQAVKAYEEGIASSEHYKNLLEGKLTQLKSRILGFN